MGHRQKCEGCGLHQARSTCPYCGVNICPSCRDPVKGRTKCGNHELPAYVNFLSEHNFTPRIAMWLGLVRSEGDTTIDLCPVCRKPRTKTDVATLKAIFGGKDPRRCLRCSPIGTVIFPLQYEIPRPKLSQNGRRFFS